MSHRGGWIQRRCRDFVPVKPLRRGEIDGLARTLAGRGSDGGEISGQHIPRWNECRQRVGVGTLRGALVSAEKEELVAYDAAADHAAELIALQRVACGSEEVARVEVAVAEEFEKVAVEGVGTGFGNDVDGTAGVQAVLGWEAVGHDVEFFDGIVSPLIEELEFATTDPHVRATKQKMLAAGIHSVSAQLFERYPPTGNAPSFIMSTFPGDTYSVAALLAAVAAAEIGYRSVFLEQLTPAELSSIAAGCGSAAVGVHIGTATPDYGKMLSELRDRLGSAPIVLSGAGMPLESVQKSMRSMRDFSNALRAIWERVVPVQACG